MQDRFKFRAVLHQNKYEEYQLEKFSHQRIFNVMSINLGIEYSTIGIIAEYPNGDWAIREIDDKDIDLIQSTGLKDKNGKLIYEGDRVYIDCEGETAIIKWSDDLARFTIHFEDEAVFADFDNYYSKELEVIGNIYENPEVPKE